MPLSKPVTKQKLLLPSQQLFHQLPKAKKREVLQRLSVDNLITYLEYIVYGGSLQTKDNLVTLEQIVEEDCKFNSSCSTDSFVTEWIHKNASIARQAELQGKSSKEIQFSVKVEEKPHEVIKQSGGLNDLTNGHFSNTFGKSVMNQANADIVFASNPGVGVSKGDAVIENHYRFKNSWDVPTQLSSAQWKNSVQKENVMPLSPTNALSNNWNGSLFENKNLVKGSSAALFGLGSVNDDKSRIAQQQPRFPFTSLFPNNARIEDLGNVLANTGPFSSFNTSFASPLVEQYTPMYDPLELASQARMGTKSPSFFGNQPSGLSFPQVESINLEVKDSKLFESFNLPPPTVFNQMPNDRRAKILSSLPVNVKNKYELFCWANQNNVERRRFGADLAV